MYYRTKTASQTDFNGDSYYYETNQQGDVTGLYKITYDASTKVLSATRVASYEYDAWGNVTYSTGTMAKINPLKYRGYYHDAESGFDDLQNPILRPGNRAVCEFMTRRVAARQGREHAKTIGILRLEPISPRGIPVRGPAAVGPGG